MGDSLTVGYQSSANGTLIEPTPYTKFLENRLSRMGEGGQKIPNFKIHNKGLLGALTGEMAARLDRDVPSLKPDFAIILGGSNDLGWGFSPQQVFNNLVKMYETNSKCRVEIIACSVPSILGYDPLIPPRLALNDMIRSYCLEKGKAFADLFRATADPRTNRLLDEYSNDGLHLSTLGYHKIADTIFDEALQRLLSKRLSKHI